MAKTFVSNTSRTQLKIKLFARLGFLLRRPTYAADFGCRNVAYSLPQLYCLREIPKFDVFNKPR